jgi:cytochrome P450
MTTPVDTPGGSTPGEPEARGQGFNGLSAATLGRLAVMCPQAVHAELRAPGPIGVGEDGSLMVHGMSELREVCRDRGIDALSAHASETRIGRPMIPLEIDGPLHTTFRRLLNPLFSPSAVAGLEPAVRQTTDELVETFIADGRADVYDRLCRLLPAISFLRFMGLPLSGLAECLDFKEAIVRHRTDETPAENAARSQGATDQFEAYFREVLDARRLSDEQPDDLMTALLALRIDDGPLDDDTVFDIVRILIIGGLDTLAAALSLDLCWLAQHPDERRRLVANPDLWRNAAEELLRFETIIPVGFRYAREDVGIAGRNIAAGTTVHVSWAGANLDPQVFPDPLTVDLTREPNPHVTFAAGIHHCLGAHLARLELRTALDQFHRRIPDYELDTGVELHFESVPIRMVSPLPLVWAP